MAFAAGPLIGDLLKIHSRLFKQKSGTLLAVRRSLPCATVPSCSSARERPLRLASPQLSACGCRSPDALLASLLDAFPQSSLLSRVQRQRLTSLAKSLLFADESNPGNPKKSKSDRVMPPKREDVKGSASGGPGGKKPGEEDGDDKNVQSLLVKALLWMLTGYIFVALLSVLVPSKNVAEPVRYISWNEFVHHMLAKGEVDHLVIHPDMETVTVVLHEGAIVRGKRAETKIYHLNMPDIGDFEEKLREAEAKLGIAPESQVPIVYDRSSDFLARLVVTMVAVTIIGIILSSMFSGRAGSAASTASKGFGGFDPFGGLSRAKFTMIDPMSGEGKGVRFSDVAGLKEAKQEIMEFVDYLRRPEFYMNLGAKVPKGALLLGPPGCGKTMLAKAVATEASVPFFAMNGSEFIEMIGGLGAARVRDLFKEAKKRAPCIVFIDEIDAVGRKRASGVSGFDGGTGEGEQTLNQLLVEMDGMDTVGGIIVLGATNRADILDRALLRPGRFDRHINIDLPTLAEREEIFVAHMKNVVLDKAPSHYARRMAGLTPGFTGADIANVVNEAALHAAREMAKTVTAADLEYAVERVVGGTEKKTSVMSMEEKKIVAYHESGHALAGWLLEHTDALLKVTIVPRTQAALGFARYDTQEKRLHSREELFDKMCMALAGRAAELYKFDRATTGAQDDLKKVTKMAYAQVRKFGLSDNIGPLSFADPGEESPLGQFSRRPYSKQLASLIDFEAQQLIARAFTRTQRLINENADKLEKIAELLLQKEVLDYADVEKLIGPPTFKKKRFVDSVEFEQSIRMEGGSSEKTGGDHTGGNGDLDDRHAPAPA